MADDKISTNVRVAKAIYNAAPAMRTASPARRAAIAKYLRAIATTINDVVASLGASQMPHGKCGEMLAHANMLPAQIGDIIGQTEAAHMAQQLRNAYDVEHFLAEYSGKRRRAEKFGELAFAAGYYNAAAVAVEVGDVDNEQEVEPAISAQAQTLAAALNGHFTMVELEDLAFQLGIDWENLRGDVKKAKARSLVLYCEQRGAALKALRALMIDARPGLAL